MTPPVGCRRAGSSDERGAASTEMVLVMPVLIVFLFLVVAAGRLTDAKSDVVAAANDAARAASLSPVGDGQGAAVARAQSAAAATVSGEGMGCQGGGPQVSLTFTPAFEPGATIHVVVTCDVHTGDLALLNLPGVITVTEHAWEPIDAHRSQ